MLAFRVEPIEGKPNTFALFDKTTGERVNIIDHIRMKNDDYEDRESGKRYEIGKLAER